ncbi:hypothetical protein yc1106_03658 [Curvularia clavata]|uniref:Chromodomain-helicase-DNA-binding protein 1-like C-terminal domain-containing protein n=1 Tax=Curvularia clavata TaxID=95742 RepID=A0A9Q8Z7M7_CURCL|nr:hypothetical protein yc1106_03658 [Curvularia clavata]
MIVYNEGGVATIPGLKNLLGAIGIMCFCWGTTITFDGGKQLEGKKAMAVLICGCIFSTTGHAQDLRDRSGDAIMGRKTIPLLLSPLWARWSLAVLIAVWTAGLIALWQPPLIVSVAFIVLGLRTLGGYLASYEEKDDYVSYIYYSSRPPKTRDRGPKSNEDTQTDFSALDVLRNTAAPATSIDACTGDGFALNNQMRISGCGILLVGGEAYRWRPWLREQGVQGTTAENDAGKSAMTGKLLNAKGQWEVPEEAWGVLELVYPKPDLLIIGTGPNTMPIAPTVRKYLNGLGIRLDIQDTRNAAAQRMGLNRVFRALTAVFAPLLSLAIRTFQKLVDSSMKRGPGTRLEAGDKEAVLDTTPLLKQDDSSAHRVHTNLEVLTIPRPPALPDIHNPTLPLVRNIGSNLSVIQSFRSSSLSLNSSSARMHFGGSEDSMHNTDPSNTNRLSLIAILSPVHKDLQKLRTLTPESLPPYSSRLRTKSHAQILKYKLLPIGRAIVAHLDLVPQQDQGALELQLCRFIATEYWPLPVNDSAHLRIQEMYRNALFKHDQCNKINALPDHRLSTPAPEHLSAKDPLLT